MKITKEIVAIIALTVLGVAFANFGISEHILWGIIVAISGIAGFKLGYAMAEYKFKEDYLAFKYYYRQLVSTMCYLVGSFLLAEHIWTHGSSWDWWSFPYPGHEMMGLALILAGILIGLRKEPHGKD